MCVFPSSPNLAMSSMDPRLTVVKPASGPWQRSRRKIREGLPKERLLSPAPAVKRRRRAPGPHSRQHRHMSHSPSEPRWGAVARRQRGAFTRPGKKHGRAGAGGVMFAPQCCDRNLTACKTRHERSHTRTHARMWAKVGRGPLSVSKQEPAR